MRKFHYPRAHAACEFDARRGWFTEFAIANRVIPGCCQEIDMKNTRLIGLDTIDTVPLYELVYERLNKALMAGQIRPGEKLTSRKLARELGTSDMPVRARSSEVAVAPGFGSTTERLADAADHDSRALCRSYEYALSFQSRRQRKLPAAGSRSRS